MDNQPYYVDEIENDGDCGVDGDFGVFHESRGSYCYFVGNEQDCKAEAERLNKINSK